MLRVLSLYLWIFNNWSRRKRSKKNAGAIRNGSSASEAAASGASSRSWSLPRCVRVRLSCSRNTARRAARRRVSRTSPRCPIRVSKICPARRAGPRHRHRSLARSRSSCPRSDRAGQATDRFEAPRPLVVVDVHALPELRIDQVTNALELADFAFGERILSVCGVVAIAYRKCRTSHKSVGFGRIRIIRYSIRNALPKLSMTSSPKFKRDQSDPGSSPCSRPRQSHGQTSPGSLHIHRLQPGRGAGNLNRRRDRHA
jgi:hypothetical protein